LPLAVAAFQPAPGRCNKRFLGGLISVRSRKLGTAFHSPVTTLAPPLRGQCSWPAPSIPRPSLAGGAFQRYAGSMQQTHPRRIGIPPEPETRNGLSLARNDACATITGSMLPGLLLRFHAEIPAPARSIPGSPLGSVSKPKPGEFITFDPLPTLVPALL